MALSLLAALGQATDTPDPDLATRVKAAFVFKFTHFVRWPQERFASDDAPFVIGVAGEDPFGAILDATVAGERVQGRPIELRRLGTGRPSREAVSACHVLFVSGSLIRELDELLAAWRDLSVLTVSDVEGFAERGGFVELTPYRGRIVFKVNRKAAEVAGLELSARLLRLARIVESGADR